MGVRFRGGDRPRPRVRVARRCGPAVPGVFELRHVSELRGARRDIRATRWPGAVRGRIMKAAMTMRERWKMSPEARALVLVTAVLLAFGLAVLYSASAIVAVDSGHGSAYYLQRQLAGIGVGTLMFAIAAKLDAERWSKWAWPLMGLTLFLMLIVILPFTQSIAPRIHGSRRFLFRDSVQPSELAKIAVVAWTAMLVVRKG